jgi:hypothetical protein
MHRAMVTSVGLSKCLSVTPTASGTAWVGVRVSMLAASLEESATTLGTAWMHVLVP